MDLYMLRFIRLIELLLRGRALSLDESQAGRLGNGMIGG